MTPLPFHAHCLTRVQQGFPEATQHGRLMQKRIWGSKFKPDIKEI